MKAAILREFNKPLSLESIPIPEVGNNDVLVRVRASGICHSDVHIWRGREAEGTGLPLIMGHECAGVIARVGANVKNVKVGDRVVVDYRLTCGQCYYCNSGRTNLCLQTKDFGFTVNGGYAEYSVLAGRQVFPLPDEISFEEGAVIGCAVVTAYHATRVAEIRTGDSVAVIGIGGVGYHILKLCRAAGARRIIAVDVDDGKLARAAKLGAETINPQNEPAEKRIKEVTRDEGVDIAFEAIGIRKTVEAAIRSLSPVGRAVLVGLCFEKVEISPLQDMIWEPRIANSGKETQIRASADHTRADLQEIIELVRHGTIDLSDSITHRLSLDDANRGLEMVEKKIGNPVRIVMLQN
jgi:alcohol dehydrogenase, propanol-preferring